MRVLVTGATGFLGRHLVERISAAQDVTPFSGDVRDAAAWEKVEPVDVVYHLAAQVSVPAAIEDPARTWDVNANGTLRMLEWARTRSSGARVVVLSTAHVYGRPERSPIDETHPLRPVSPYGASKVAAEALAAAYAATYKLDTVIVRPFNVYGPGQARGYLVTDILHQLKEGRELRLGDARPVRDFTFVDDAVAMLELAGTEPRASGQVLNLGFGRGYSVAEMAETAVRVSGSTLKPIFDPSRHRVVETLQLVVDNRRAQEVLGWRPKVDLEEGLRRTWESLS